MAQDQLMRAKELIEQRRYSEARSILQGLDHPKAREWLGKLDSIDAQMAAPTVQQPIPTTLMPQPGNPYAAATVQPDWSHMQAQPQGGALSAEAPNRITVVSIIGALIGALVGALVGVIIWTAIVYVSEYQLGWAAIILGFLVGGGAVLFSGRKHGILIALIAIVIALAGIGAAKYASFYFIGIKDVSDPFNVTALMDTVRTLPPFDPSISPLVISDIQADFDAMDILFVALAVLSAGSVAMGSSGRRRR